ncbi:MULTISPECIES: SfnB family sulfur acquisition oxidoreductase [Pseudomonas]|uniref:Acyl-CoA dehydrogenase n=2 Tax=Pseudomonadaceae TaxID=135621 RepID=A0A0D0JEF1_9PSED|nr:MULTISPECIES: SfnB family sulfur acquisition oxidoreductase [Pseudomonas]KIQ04385.1 acyl-CoA dehydrogenase [Pseudomonas fulva]MCW2293330.1 SfnB family sulfur acquisition oxidoreductase [Pseudomonas sp. BIGb0408]NYH72099.1 SfnB family sulfur acquisition oxidoreductase [Pseudomonas flavescens]
MSQTTLSPFPPQARSAPERAAHLIRSDAEAIEVARELAEAFAVEAAARDRDRRLPWAELDRFSQSGLWAITVPRAYGGAGVSYATLVEVIALISAADASLGQLPQNHFGVINNLSLTASEEQKQRFFAKVLQGYRFGNAFSEARSKNVTAFETQVRFEGDSVVIEGEKAYCTGALFAHIVPAVGVDEDNRPFIAFLPRDAEGLSVIDSWDGFGQRSTASGQVLLDKVRVPRSEVIPAWKAYDQPTADGPVSQIIQAAVDTGIARGAFAELLKVARQARPWVDSGLQHGWQDPLSQALIGDLAWRLSAAEAILQKSARAVDHAVAEPSEDSVAEASLVVGQAKVLSTEIALAASSRLFELGGTRSVSSSQGLDRFWRNARTHTLHDPVRWKYHLVGNLRLNGIKPQRHSWN